MLNILLYQTIVNSRAAKFRDTKNKTINQREALLIINKWLNQFFIFLFVFVTQIIRKANS